MKQGIQRRRARGGDTQLFSLRLPLQLWRELSVFAKLRDVSMNALLCDVIEQFWAEHPDRARIARIVKSSPTSGS